MNSWAVDWAARGATAIPDPNTTPLIHHRIWPRHSLALASLMHHLRADRDLIVAQHLCQSMMHFDVAPVIKHTNFDLPQKMAVLPSGDLAISDRDGRCLHIVSVNGVYIKHVLPPNILGPLGLWVGLDHSILVCDMIGDKLSCLSSHTYDVVYQTTAARLGLPKDVCEVGKLVVVSLQHRREIQVFNRDLADEGVTIVRNIKPNAVAVHPVTGTLYYVDELALTVTELELREDEFVVKHVWRLNDILAKARTPEGGPLRAVSPATSFDGLAVFPDGSFMIADGAAKRLLHIAYDEPKDKRCQQLLQVVSQVREEVFEYPVGIAILPYHVVAVGDRDKAHVVTFSAEIASTSA